MSSAGAAHDPEPAAGLTSKNGTRPADLFNLAHYPVQGTCRVCGEDIKAASFFAPFTHDPQPLATVLRFPAT